MPKWIVALALLACFAPAARAGGLHAEIEGPAADGVTHTARMNSSEPGDAFEPWAHAEGVVDGKRRSVLLRVEPTAEPGVYTFQRRWPAEGRWMIRFNLGHPPAPATVVSLHPDGSVQKNAFHRKSDGSRECHRALREFLPPTPRGKPRGSGDDC